MANDLWAAGERYEPYIGRWSRRVAPQFVAWLQCKPRADWLDVGCGTGALTSTILRDADPRSVVAVDPSRGFIDYAAAHVADPRVRFEAGDAQSLPVTSASFDVAVAGLVLNFVPQPPQALAEMARALRPGGALAVYVWDYAGGMGLMRTFWDAAVALDPAAAPLDEGRRFTICEPAALSALLSAVVGDVDVRAIDIETRFADFDDCWSPFLGGTGPAPAYAMSLDERKRKALRERIRAALPTAADGSIALVARAWAARGTKR
jgi:SAM-dependent methyltransferase